MLLDLFYVDAWCPETQEPRTFGILLHKHLLPATAAPMADAYRLVALARWGPGRLVLLDQAGRRVDPEEFR